MNREAPCLRIDVTSHWTNGPRPKATLVTSMRLESIDCYMENYMVQSKLIRSARECSHMRSAAYHVTWLRPLQSLRALLMVNVVLQKHYSWQGSFHTLLPSIYYNQTSQHLL